MQFHLQSWLDVAAQMRHGGLLPRWNFLSAYNAGEPRYIFYPPLSWMLGGALTLALPFPWVATVLSWMAMCIAGFSMRRLVARWASPFAAAMAACVYLANPFMVFSSAARSAYGEIFAAALMPLLMAALLSAEPGVVALALPLAGVVLSNVPGAVIAAYLYAALALMRVLRATHGRGARLRLLRSFLGGALLAGGLTAFYLLPAWHQRSRIHAGEPFIFPLRPVDSLFFGRVLQAVADDFLLRVGHLAAAMALATFVLLGAYWLMQRRAAHEKVVGSAAAMSLWIALAVCFMLTAASGFLWRSLPGLYILQFPWRLLMLLAICLALAVALVLRRVQLCAWAGTMLTLATVAALAVVGFRMYVQPCDASETPMGTRQRLVVQHHAPEPIDEYVAARADPEMMRPDNPPYWLASSPQEFAPGTTPNRAKTVPGAEMSPVPDGAQLSATPLTFSVNAQCTGFVVVNLQAYPNWRVLRNGEPVGDLPLRPDGLLVVPVEAGVSHIAIRWQHGWDEWVGGAVSLLAWGWLLVGNSFRRSAIWKRRPVVRYADASS